MRKAKLFISLLRIGLGWVFLYQGIVAFRTPGWSVQQFIVNAQTFPQFYAKLLQAPMLGYVSLTVQILFVVVGIMLIIGLWSRISALLGILLMLFFYFPLLKFPYVGNNYLLIDEHIIYSLILAYFFVGGSSSSFKLKNLFKRSYSSSSSYD
jgi:thiosulfate dehydrogenase [quinone] large subunit